jgi:hypothetical protein
VIWQVGTNAVLRNLDPTETARQVEDGVARIQASGSDIVLVDPQYSPRVYERGHRASRMVRMLSRVASIRHVGIFPRFEVMREWHENQSLPVDSFVIADGLRLLRPALGRRHHQVRRPDQARRQPPRRSAKVSADVTLR